MISWPHQLLEDLSLECHNSVNCSCSFINRKWTKISSCGCIELLLGVFCHTFIEIMKDKIFLHPMSWIWPWICCVPIKPSTKFLRSKQYKDGSWFYTESISVPCRHNQSLSCSRGRKVVTRADLGVEQRRQARFHRQRTEEKSFGRQPMSEGEDHGRGREVNTGVEKRTDTGMRKAMAWTRKSGMTPSGWFEWTHPAYWRNIHP